MSFFIAIWPALIALVMQLPLSYLLNFNVLVNFFTVIQVIEKNTQVKFNFTHQIGVCLPILNIQLSLLSQKLLAILPRLLRKCLNGECIFIQNHFLENQTQ